MVIYGTPNDDLLVGGEDDDSLWAQQGNDTLIGGAGNDTLSGGDDDDWLDGGTGNNDLRGGDGNDTYVIDASSTNMIAEGANTGIDTVRTDGSYTLGYALENLVLTGSAASNGSGNELNNRIIGNASSNLLAGEDGEDFLDGMEGNDTLLGGAGNDTLGGGEGDDWLDGGDGINHMAGGRGNDTYVVGANSADYIIEIPGEGIDTVRSNGSYGLGAYLENLVLTGDAASEGRGNELDNEITGNANANRLKGDSGNDRLFGMAGNDTLEGGDGDDWLDGGEGANELRGGNGNDTYVIETPSPVTGNSNFIYEDANAGIDTVRSSGSYTLGYALENLVLTGSALTGSGNELDNQITGNASDNLLFGANGNDRLYGLDGKDTLNGDTGNDSLYGGDGDDQLWGGEGDDWLDGGTGVDMLNGGIGNDTYVLESPVGGAPSTATILESNGGGVDTVRSNRTYALGNYLENLLLTGDAAIDGNGNELDNEVTGNASENRLKGETGNDRLYGMAGKDNLEGGAGNDSLFGGEDDDNLLGGDGDDRLNGGTGNDLLNGGNGNDTYVLERGWGQDVIDNYDSANGVDVIEFAAGIVPNDIQAVHQGDDLILNLKGSTDSVRVRNYFLSNGVSNYSLEQIRFSGGVTWSYSVLRSLVVSGSSGNDLLNGFSGADTLDGGAGNDTLDGAEGNDLLVGGAGNDLLSGGAGVDTLRGGSGDDTYVIDSTTDLIQENVNEGTDTLESSVSITALAANIENLRLTGSANLIGYGNSANNLLTGNQGANSLYGNAGNDTLSGEGGNDYLEGGLGNDVYRFARGWGADSVNNFESTGNGLDAIEFAADILPGDIKISRSFNNLVLSLTGTNDKVTVSNYFGSDGTLTYAVDEIRFANGVRWTVADIKAWALQSTSGNDTLTGYASADTIHGDAGNDSLSGADGNDSLDGGSGNDVLDGGNGNDRLDGGAGSDTLRGGAGDDVFLVDSAGDLVSETSGIDTVEASISYSLVDGVENLTLTGSSDLNGIGNALNNTLTGNAGANRLEGGGGDDRLLGGAGNDFLQGGDGNDVYAFARGWGQDVIDDAGVEAGSLDAIEFAADIAPGDVTARFDGEDLLLRLLGSTDSIRVVGYFKTDGSNSVEQIRFADGTQWTPEQIKLLVLQGSSENDTLTGFASDDSLYGGGGNDLLYGLDGNDVLDGGDYFDTLIGGLGNDTLLGGYGDDSMVGGDGDDVYQVSSLGDKVVESLNGGIDTIEADLSLTLVADVENLKLTGTQAINGTGNELDNVIVGNSGNNTLSGAAGNDLLDAGAGDDRLIGGAGDDTLVGGAGNDVFVVDSLGDQVSDASGIDTVEASISYSLGEEVENLTLTGTANLNGSGNTLNNTLTGNAGANLLEGGAGNDRLVGAAGNDTLQGGEGSDTYVYASGWGRDVIADTGAEGVDVIEFAAGINPSLIKVSHEGDDLLLASWEGADSIRVVGYFNTASGGTPELIRFADGTQWDREQLRTRMLQGDIGNDTLFGFETADKLIGNGGNDQLFGQQGDDTLYGWSGNDLLDGGDGNDILEGYTGNDTMIGGAGDDRYWVNGGDTIIEAVDGGVDTVYSRVSLTLGDNLENLELSGPAVDGIGNALNNDIRGGDGNNLLKGGAGDDRLNGGQGKDTLSGGLGNDTYVFNNYWGQDIIQNADAGVGKHDVIEFADFMPEHIHFERFGDDLIFSRNNTVDTLTVSGFFQGDGKGPSSIEEVRLANGVIWSGDYIRNKLLEYSNSNDTLRGYATDDSLYGAAGNDNLQGYEGNDVLDGGEGHDRLEGGSGNDVLIGGLGNDVMDGGTGDDLYQVDSLEDRIIENAGAGIDTVQSGISLTLAANVENLALTGATAIDGVGNELGNQLVGNAANNVLSGGAGNDTLLGGAGNDTLVGGAGNDQLSGGEGSDVYLFGAGWGRDVIDNLDTSSSKLDVVQFLEGVAVSDITVIALGDNLFLRHANLADSVTVTNFFGPSSSTSLEEIRFADGTIWTAAQLRARFTSGTEGNDQLVGFSGDDTLLGYGGNDTLRGGAGNDVFEGGAGTNFLVGGAGDDLYRVESSTDVIVESANEGVDTVESSASTFTLSWNIENLTLIGSANIEAWGNNEDNLMIGNEGNNGLYGGVGNNTLYGNGGDDKMVTGSGIDYMDGGDGNDSVVSGYGNDTLLGGAGNDTLDGGRDDDWLYGGAGNDTLYGDSGNDIFVIDSAGDTVIESINNGNDTVESSIGYTLAYVGNVENLTLTGSDAINGTGNTMDNVLRGNSAANVLSGGTGNDTLSGNAGNDTLIGGAGSDTYVFGLGDGQDLIQNTDAAPESVDTLQFGAGISIEQLWFRQNGSSLEVSVVGGEERVSIDNWYGGNASHLDQFKAADGRTLLDSQVQGLVDAMAAFGVPAGAESNLTTAQRDELNLVIAANWQ
jgi:Ca2+-binding RTX toxin-like protein